jgi:hypothetical protein
MVAWDLALIEPYGVSMRTKTSGKSSKAVGIEQGGGKISQALRMGCRKEEFDIIKQQRWDDARDGCAGAEGYIKVRQNGSESDSPLRSFERDGIYSWENPFAVSSQIKYTEGAQDRAWMKERDRNYIFRLENEGRLDVDEPRLETEVPALYKEVQAYREVKFEFTPPNRIKKLLGPINANKITKFDLSVVSEEQLLSSFAEVRKQIGSMKEDRFIVPDFVPLSPEEFNQIFQALIQNFSVKMVNFGDIDLSEHGQAIVALIDRRPDIVTLSSTQTVLSKLAPSFNLARS